MITRNTYRVLVWAIVVLLATNLSMGFSFLYHKQQDRQLAEKAAQDEIEIPAQQRARFFREQLSLDAGQLVVFRDLNREFNRTGHQINGRLERLRVEMVAEMGTQKPNAEKLKGISAEIGQLHAQLKTATIDYYLKMKAVCNPAQQEKLNTLFMQILQENEDVSLPARRGRNRGNR